MVRIFLDIVQINQSIAVFSSWNAQPCLLPRCLSMGNGTETPCILWCILRKNLIENGLVRSYFFRCYTLCELPLFVQTSYLNKDRPIFPCLECRCKQWLVQLNKGFTLSKVQEFMQLHLVDRDTKFPFISARDVRSNFFDIKHIIPFFSKVANYFCNYKIFTENSPFLPYFCKYGRMNNGNFEIQVELGTTPPAKEPVGMERRLIRP